MSNRPKWTVHCNIVSPENQKWIGTSWEFFDSDSEAEMCFNRHLLAHDCPCKRPYYGYSDRRHLAEVHRQRGEG